MNALVYHGPNQAGSDSDPTMQEPPLGGRREAQGDPPRHLHRV
jgi:hypothetical protein